jgi:membrane-associated protease RseP (regulator of RpoE activity)
MTELLAYTVGVVLFALGVVASIALHEVGHMYPAKKFGIKVTQYFVGFGRTVWSRKRGETEYGVKAVPLGGFVKLVGMLPPEQGGDPHTIRRSNTGMFTQLISDARHQEYEHVEPGDEDRLFYRKPWWQKLIVMVGGPMVNVALAFLLLGGVWMLYGVYEPKPVVEEVSDCVIAVTEEDPDRTCTASDPVAPARDAGLRPGDRIQSFNGIEITSWDQLSTLIRGNDDGAATIVVERGGERRTMSTSTTVSARYEGPGSDEVVDVGFLGVLPVQTLERQGPAYVVTTMGEMTQQVGHALVQMPERMIGVFQAAFLGADRDDNSPVSVVGASRVAGEVASTDEWSVGEKIAGVISFIGMLNLFLALFNFIPLPPLDGGHIAGALYEALRRGIAKVFGRPDPGYVDVAKMLPVAYAVAGVLLVTSVILVYADLVNPVRLGL